MEKCEGCLKDVYSFNNPCWECVKARHKAVMKRKCSCGKHRRESEVHRIHSRTWISCLRCLGTIKQLS